VSGQVSGPGGSEAGQQRQGPVTLEFTVEIGGTVTMAVLDELLDSLERASVLTVSRIPNVQIATISHALR
jgi:hypothetical protein